MVPKTALKWYSSCLYLYTIPQYRVPMRCRQPRAARRMITARTRAAAGDARAKATELRILFSDCKCLGLYTLAFPEPGSITCCRLGTKQSRFFGRAPPRLVPRHYLSGCPLYSSLRCGVPLPSLTRGQSRSRRIYVTMSQSYSNDTPLFCQLDSKTCSFRCK